MEHDTDLAGWEIRASSHLTADLISRALPGDERAQRFSGGLIPHSPEPAHVHAFVLLCPHKCTEDESQKYFELRGDLFFFLSCHPRLSDLGEKEGGMQGVNNNKQEGKRCLALGEFSLGQFDLSQSTLSA